MDENRNASPSALHVRLDIEGAWRTRHSTSPAVSIFALIRRSPGPGRPIPATDNKQSAATADDGVTVAQSGGRAGFVAGVRTVFY